MVFFPRRAYSTAAPCQPDILSMWVGATEANIAAAFREAEREEAVLIFDEVDSLLRDRRDAMRSWEVTQVNEFLQQLESYGGVVVCTTNLWRDIDAAALRRFVFKVEFGCLRPEGALALFKSCFGEVLASPLEGDEEGRVRDELRALRTLVPGDFAAVRRQATALGEKLSARELLARLAREVGARRTSARIGF